MEFKKYYIVFLKKGPLWTDKATPALEALQEEHMAHIRSMAEGGRLVLAGPVADHSDAADIRGIHLMHIDQFESIEEMQALVEADPMIVAQHLRADYGTWWMEKSAQL